MPLERFSRREFNKKGLSFLAGVPFSALLHDLDVLTFEQTPNQTGEKSPEIAKYNAPDIFRIGDKTQSYIYLTIDDCWVPSQVEKALDIAAQYEVKFTFFPGGTMLTRSPELWRRAVKEGHSIQNHTQTHRRLNLLSEEEIRWEILTQQKTLEGVLDTTYKQQFLRPPWGAGIFVPDPRIPRIAKELGYKIAMWSSDSQGWKMHPRTDSEALSSIRDNVLKNLFKGVVVLQHGIPCDVQTLPDIIIESRRQGLKCISLAEGIV